MRRIFKLISRLLGEVQFSKYILLGISSGFLSFVFINMVTRSLSLIVAGKLFAVRQEFIIIFSLVIVIFMWIWRALSVGIINLSQRLFWNLRKQILASILRASYQEFKGRRDKIYSTIVSDVNILTNASMSIISFCTALILALSCLIYLLSLSPALFLVAFAAVIAGMVIYRYGARNNMRDFDQARDFEDRFLEVLNDTLDGFKEIFMEPRKGRDIFDNKVTPVARSAYQYNTKAFTGFLNNQVTGQILFYCVIASILLYFSTIFKVRPEDTVSFVFTLLYLLTSVETIMVLLPHIIRARVATFRILDLLDDLQEPDLSNCTTHHYMKREEFQSITITDLEFSYGQQDFAVGPIDLNIHRGEIIFIYGSNGSGKTTLMNAILGLCRPTAGIIRYNEHVLTQENYAEYRSLFAVVFSNFYLFRELIGIDHVNEGKWKHYLQMFELQNKVNLYNRAFSTTDLSIGQRKRLALIVSLLEEKPVVVMDEWAADQDPYFRKKFYTEILPQLKAEGMTILAITHDDKYYHCADRLFKMDEGRLREEKPLFANT
jgi:putative ATP-binding cassette transporter